MATYTPSKMDNVPGRNFPSTGLLVEAEAFDDYGGWTMDSLLAHGNGVPVADASTTIKVSEPGDYKIWVRAKDWVPGHHPGRFQLRINSNALPKEFGANDQDWSWESGGTVHLVVGVVKLTLHDLTGFCGLTKEELEPPNVVDEASRAWRRRFRRLPEHPVMAGHFDVVVVGGGFVGCAAALTAARLGLGGKVALVQDRPVLGGNSSVEIGSRDMLTFLRQACRRVELMQRHPNGDLYAKQLLDAEPHATVFLNYTVYNATTSGSTITSVDAREAKTGREIRLTATTFIDCSGKAIFGEYCRAATMFGQESQDEYGESLAPEKGDNMHHGNTLFFRTEMSESGPVDFSNVPWATEVAKDYANLGGQLICPGFENEPGPKVERPDTVEDRSIAPRMKRANTHYWEHGQWLDPYQNAEHIRDHLLRAIYGTFSNVKSMEPENYANLLFEWLAFVPGQGEFRRYRGPHVLTENDVRSHRVFPDAVVQQEAAFCLHYPYGEDGKYDFRLKHWIWDERDGKPFDIPFRCLYSSNISNLLMAGKHINVTHIAGSCSKRPVPALVMSLASRLIAKLMGNGAQHAIATAVAAFLCRKYFIMPAKIYENPAVLRELQSTVLSLTQPHERLARL